MCLVKLRREQAQTWQSTRSLVKKIVRSPTRPSGPRAVHKTPCVVMINLQPTKALWLKRPTHLSGDADPPRLAKANLNFCSDMACTDAVAFTLPQACRRYREWQYLSPYNAASPAYSQGALKLGTAMCIELGCFSLSVCHVRRHWSGCVGSQLSPSHQVLGPVPSN